MKITKRKLRRLISESIKDQEEFNLIAKQISKAYDQIKKDNPEVGFRAETHSMPADVAQRKVTGLRRDMKRLWNEKADHSYFQDPSKFICVHYVGGNSVSKEIESFFKSAKPKAKNTFELSTIGYASMKDVGKGGFMGRKFGFILSPRRVTYAAHSDIGSENTSIKGFSKAGEEQHKQMEKEIISKLPLDVQNDPVKRHQVVTNILRQKLFGSSGSAKRPMLSAVTSAVFDEEDVKRALKVPAGILESTDIIAEVICDNWTASTFVLPSINCGELYLDWDKLAKYGLKYYVYDTGETFENKESMPEKYKQAAAKRLQRRKENEEYFASIAKKKAEAEAEKAQAEKEKKDKADILANNPEAADVEFIGDDPNDYVLILERLLELKGKIK